MTDAEILSMLYDIRSALDSQDLDAIYDRIEPVITLLESKEVPT